jgi:molybdopterin-guanine dinucleotide biosynthesis protein A
MIHHTKTTGVILAGGLARRMANRDKGLVNFNGQPLISYAIDALSTVVDQMLINANRNSDQYQHFGLPVVADQTDNFDGPLAGLLAAMTASDAEILLVIPCDSPFITAQHLQKLLLVRTENDADVAVACDGERLHAVFLALKTSLKSSLEHYLASGERKVETWLRQQNMVTADFCNETEIFANINTLAELTALEKRAY